ncbi:uncharacterized protein LOC134822194 [Bolinopsis microptera]|uniref:uncharacterized protein LOC134822194 n=1 Tax=Bolinopsis microptera TaxID=2820187 RepID=UPI00307A7B3B
MPGRHNLLEANDDMGSEDGYYEDDYLPKVDNLRADGYEEEFKKAISVLEQKHKHPRNGEVHNICDTQVKENEDELYLKKVSLYRSVANRQSMTRRSIDSDLDKLSSSLISSKERWSSQTDVNDDVSDFTVQVNGEVNGEVTGEVNGEVNDFNDVTVDGDGDVTVDINGDFTVDVNGEYVSLQAPEMEDNKETSQCSLQVHNSPIRSSHSSNSLQSDNRKLSDNKLNGSSVSLPLNRTLSNLSLQAKHLNKSNSSVDSSCSMPDGWEKVESKTGVYYWHVPSGTTQYQHPNLSSNQDLSEKVCQLQISTPETEEQSSVSRDQDHTSHLPPEHHKVINLGYMEMDASTLKAANSSVSINECIRKLSSIMNDPSQTDNLSLQILLFEGTYLKLLDYNSRAVLSRQNILTIRRWGVGSDDVRNFAYVVKQKGTNNYRCFVLHCYNPASQIALHMKNICKLAAEKREEELIKEFNYDQQEDVEGCVARWSDQLEKNLHMDYREIDYESREKIKTKDKTTLSGWVVDAVDLVRRQSSQMYLLKEIIECFKTEALADKEKVIRLQGQLLMQKDEQLQLLKTSVEETVQTTVESGIQNYSAAVQQNSASGTVCNSKILKKVMKSVAAEEDRSKNLIVFGLKEEEEEQLPALVTAILMKTGRLRETHKDVWICPDRSSEERATRKHLVTDLKKKRAEQTHLDHYIRYGKVCSRDKKSS